MSRRVKVFFEERKKSIKLSLFFFRELFVNSIQNNPTRYTKRETYRSGVDGEPGASLGGSSGSLEVDLFVRATILERGRERRLGQRAFCWIGHRKRSTRRYETKLLPTLME